MLIGVDHGNKQIKTVNCTPFVAGLQQSTTEPYGKEVLMFNDSYYTFSDKRIPYRRDKAEDDRFFVLTLFAFAREIEARQCYSEEVIRIKLSVALPPAHFGAQVEKFKQYFQNRGIVKYYFRKKPYKVYIEHVECFPQAYAAASTMLSALINDSKAVIVDIGGFTADYLMMKSGRADLSICDSLENGVILLYNRIHSRASAELDLLLDENDVDAILMSKTSAYPQVAVNLVEKEAQEFVNDLFSTLRERMLDLRFIKVIFVGGGAILLRRQIEGSGKVGAPLFVPEINAIAKGCEYLYQIDTLGR